MSSSRLVDELSVLLRALHLPLTLESPTDLTPSLLLAILESILSSRLPLSQNLRNALLSKSSKSKEARNAKIQCMQIFLGVIETDILKTDVGLNRIDPRKLANGDWDEVVFVGKILCWIGRELGITAINDPIKDHGEELERHVWRLTPSTALDASDTSSSHPSSSLSLPTADTSHSLHDFDNLRSFRSYTSSFSPQLSPLSFPRPSQSRHTREVSPLNAQDVSVIGSELSSVRYSGYIEPVDEELELSYFESSRSSCSNNTLDDIENPRVDDIEHGANQDISTLAEILGPHPLTQTISLLQQRAYLLRELAKYHSKRD